MNNNFDPSKLYSNMNDISSKITLHDLPDIVPVGELMREQTKIQKEQLDEMKNNYDKLSELYQIKVREAEKFEQEADRSKKYNTKMLVVSLVSGGIALTSLVAMILIAVLQ